MNHRLFRCVEADENGRPVVGQEAGMLGVRVPIDIRPDEAGLVHPGAEKGLSVSPGDPRNLPRSWRPEFYQGVPIGGMCLDPLFEIGERDLGVSLRFVPDSKKPTQHGVVEPATEMQISAYQSALADTINAWRNRS